jgi:hypothetical protein
MDREGLPREYRTKSGKPTGLLVRSLLGVAVAMLPMWAADVVPRWAAWLMTVSSVGLCGWLIIASGRCATIVDLKGIKVRGLARQRRLSWSGIQDIQADPNRLADGEVLGWVCYVYGPNSQRVHLPYVDDTVNVEGELAFLRSVWEELRGDDWTLTPGARRGIAKRQAMDMALATGMVAAVIAVLPLILLMFLLPQFAGLPGFLESLLSWWLLVILLPGIFAGTSFVSYRRWRRALCPVDGV